MNTNRKSTLDRIGDTLYLLNRDELDTLILILRCAVEPDSMTANELAMLEEIISTWPKDRKGPALFLINSKRKLM